MSPSWSSKHNVWIYACAFLNPELQERTVAAGQGTNAVTLIKGSKPQRSQSGWNMASRVRLSTTFVTFLAAFLPEEQAPRLIHQQLGVGWGCQGGAEAGLLWSLRLARATQEDVVLNKPTISLTKIKSKTKTLFIQIQVCPLVCPTALRVLEGVGGYLG